ncbi:MAG: TerD family protein [Solirubrobacteraceae bacterium]|nr:TerD family protein [Solirubrobacteraceae bacterium]
MSSINLSKGQKISLSKDGGALTKVKMGLGWDPVASAPKKGLFKRATPEKQIDLDASVVLLDANRQVVDTVWFRQLRSKDGSVTHTGDNLTGAGDGDDESILVDLSAVPSNVEVLAFTVNSFSSQGFGDVANAFCRIVDETTGAEFARYDLSAQGSHSALVMAKVYRHGGEWKMAALGDSGSGKTVAEILPLVQQVV